MADFVVIAGPTASGKTALGLRLAERLGGEIISADSRQIYRHMDIGTAKPTPDERAAAPHHLIDIVDPDQRYTATEFASAAAELIEGILARGHLPIVVGGAGFYLEALLEGLSPMPDIPGDIKTRVEQEVRESPQEAFARLRDVDPQAADRLRPSDPQRVARALEVYEATKQPISYYQSLPREPATERGALRFGLDWDRDRLYTRIDTRTSQMIEHGLEKEVESILDRGYTRDTYALKTFGYREIGAVLAGEMEIDVAEDRISQETRRYAKRQLTWFKNRGHLTWLRSDDGDPLEGILARLERPA